MRNMKLTANAAAALLLLLSICVAPNECSLNDDIRQLLEEFRLRMCHPIAKFGLPALDPLHLSHATYETNNRYLIDFNSSVTDFNLQGLSDFDVTELKISKLPLKRSVVNLTFPMTVLDALYTAKGSLGYVVNLAGEGTANAHVKMLSIAISWKTRIGVHLKINGFKLDLKIDEIFMDLENFFENERLNIFFHDFINELGLELLNDIWSVKNELVEKIIEKKINDVLGKYTLNELRKMIGSGGPIFGPDDPPPDCKEAMQPTNKT